MLTATRHGLGQDELTSIDEIVAMICVGRRNGVSDAVLLQELTAAGFTADDINAGFARAFQVCAPLPATTPPTRQPIPNGGAFLPVAVLGFGLIGLLGLAFWATRGSK